MDIATQQKAPAPVSLATNVRRVLFHPGAKQLYGLAGVAGAIAVGLTVWFWSQGTSMSPLFTGLSPEDEMAVVEALRTRNIPFEQSAEGSVLVPAEHVHNMRLALAADGLPHGSGVGFELIRDAGGLGSSPFMENARYQHVLETELARTISAMQPVRSARIHLALPRRSAFVRPSETASAAVMINLHPGRALDAGQIASIVHLVSSSVPQMSEDRVSVVDQRGTLLSRPKTGQGLDDEQLAYQERMEQRYVERIMQLLQPFTGPGRVSAQVAVDMDFSRAEQTRETYDPTSRTIRSEQTSEELRGTEAEVGGVPGALSNRPPNTAATAAESEAGSIESSSIQATRNYEINRVVEQSWQNPGRIRRINAAVVVDHLPTGADGALEPLPDEQMQRVQELVREAIGFSDVRGDSVSVQNMPFQNVATPELESIPLWEQPLIQDIARQILGLIVLLIVAFRLFKPAVSAVLKDSGAAPVFASAGAAPVALAVENSPLGEDQQFASEQAALSAPGGKKSVSLDFSQQNDFDEKIAAVREVVTQDPARVANVVRGWIADE